MAFIAVVCLAAGQAIGKLRRHCLTSMKSKHAAAAAKLSKQQSALKKAQASGSKAENGIEN